MLRFDFIQIWFQTSRLFFWPLALDLIKVKKITWKQFGAHVCTSRWQPTSMCSHATPLSPSSAARPNSSALFLLNPKHIHCLVVCCCCCRHRRALFFSPALSGQTHGWSQPVAKCGPAARCLLHCCKRLMKWSCCCRCWGRTTWAEVSCNQVLVFGRWLQMCREFSFEAEVWAMMSYVHIYMCIFRHKTSLTFFFLGAICS